MKLKITPEMRARWKRINARRAKDEKPQLNFPLWVKTRNRIDAIPESYRQSVFKGPTKRSPCGTVACLAGEAIICSAPDVTTGIKLIRINTASDKAADLLGLTNEETGIFGASGCAWASPFGDQMYVHYQRQRKSGQLKSHAAADTEADQAKIAVKYLTSVIRTGRVIDEYRQVANTPALGRRTTDQDGVASSFPIKLNSPLNS